MAAKRFVVQGRVQGVGFRYFVQKTAESLGLKGYARNLDDGSVEVFAVGNDKQLNTLCGHLWKGPKFADVRHVDEREAPPEKVSGFRIVH